MEKNQLKIKEETNIDKFIKIFDHVIWYVIGIVIILSIAYTSAHESKKIYLTGTLNCAEIVKE
jgi:hypothetical protein